MRPAPTATQVPPVVHDGLPGLVGGTPLVRLRRLFGAGGPRIFAKLESFNPGGSAKDRPAAAMLEAALRSGDLRPGDTVIESSSGNLGVALAQMCGWHGLQFVCVVDPRANRQTLQEIQAYGGRLHMLEEPDAETGDWLVARRRAVDDLLTRTPGAWTPDQYSNVLNPASHAEGTMNEVVQALGGPPAALFVATSTTGTLQGCQQHLRSLGATTRVYAVDAEGSVLFGGAAGERLLPGFGAGVVPALAATAAPDGVLRVDDVDCVVGCRRLVRSESLLAGASAGGVVTAASGELHRFTPEDDVVLVLHDGGARYLDTVYDDDWVTANLGYQALALVDRDGRPPQVA